MYISAKRLRHELRVANKMRALVTAHPEICHATPDEMFQLGYVHDCGKGYTRVDHARVGGEILKAEGFRFWKEVAHHGNPETSYRSPELDLLNWADMTVTADGKDVSLQGRLDDIALRYGKDSKPWRDAAKMAESIEAWQSKWENPVIGTGKEEEAGA